MPAPGTVAEVRSLLGMTNYSSNFIPDYSTITAPLRLMTKKKPSFSGLTSVNRHFKELRKSSENTQS